MLVDRVMGLGVFNQSHHRNGSESTNALKRSPRIYIVTCSVVNISYLSSFSLFHCLSSLRTFYISSDEILTMTARSVSLSLSDSNLLMYAHDDFASTHGVTG